MDVIVVVKLDRLFRSLKHLVSTLEEFENLGVQFVAIKDNVDYSTPLGRFFVQILGSLGEFERSLLRERTIMGLDHARSAGKKLGRPRVHNEAYIASLRQQGLTYRKIQEVTGAPMSSIWRAIKSAPKTSLKTEGDGGIVRAPNTNVYGANLNSEPERISSDDPVNMSGNTVLSATSRTTSKA